MTVFAKIKVRCELLGAVAERLVPLGAVDPVEPNTLAYAIVQDRDRVVSSTTPTTLPVKAAVRAGAALKVMNTEAVNQQGGSRCGMTPLVAGANHFSAISLTNFHPLVG